MKDFSYINVGIFLLIAGIVIIITIIIPGWGTWNATEVPYHVRIFVLISDEYRLVTDKETNLEEYLYQERQDGYVLSQSFAIVVDPGWTSKVIIITERPQ